MNLVLTRDPEQPTPDINTLGVLSVGNLHMFTMEKPWVPVPDGPAGHPDTSCIGPGTYQLKQRYTPKKGVHWILSNPALGVYETPEDIQKGQYGRCYILIHAANWARELKGCIAPGQRRVRDTMGEWMVANSQDAMNDLRALLEGQTDLSITIE